MMRARILRLFAGVTSLTDELARAALADCPSGAVDAALRDLVTSGHLRREGATVRLVASP